MNKWIAEFELEDGDIMPEHMDLEYKGARIDFHCRPLEQEPCEDIISRKSIKHKLQEHYDFLVDAYGGFSNLPQNDKSRVDEIINCIAMVVNEPSVTPQEPIKDEIILSHKEYNELVANEYNTGYRNGYNKGYCKGYVVASEEQEPVLDKVRAEIEKHCGLYSEDKCKYCYHCHSVMGVREILEVFDKYKSESENL